MQQLCASSERVCGINGPCCIYLPRSSSNLRIYSCCCCLGCCCCRLENRRLVNWGEGRCESGNGADRRSRDGEATRRFSKKAQSARPCFAVSCAFSTSSRHNTLIQMTGRATLGAGWLLSIRRCVDKLRPAARQLHCDSSQLATVATCVSWNAGIRSEGGQEKDSRKGWKHSVSCTSCRRQPCFLSLSLCLASLMRWYLHVPPFACHPNYTSTGNGSTFTSPLYPQI